MSIKSKLIVWILICCLFLSPEEPLLGLYLKTNISGNSAELTMIHTDHKLGGKRNVRFVQDIVPHPADWRGGLKWMVERYPLFFDPINPKADIIAGCGSYSNSEEVPDIKNMKQMAYRINWRARFDWPYLGLSYPPVKNNDEAWRCSDVDGAGQVIFGNPCREYRIEIARYLDGIYDEFGMDGPNLNGSAFMCVHKPLIAWTSGGGVRVQNTPDVDPDAFFQRHLLMGAYPTAPVPGNDHTILPDSRTIEFYLDYGPLLDAMRGKKWVLEPHCVETTTPDVKVNLFQVTKGYVLPVTFGGMRQSATIHLQNIPDLDKMKCEAIYPGEERVSALQTFFRGGIMTITVPLKRGCAMIRCIPQNSKNEN